MTTDELRNEVILLSGHLRVAKDRLAKRLLFEFPAKVGDVVDHPRTGQYLITRLVGHDDCVSVYVRKKTVKGWDKREITVLDLEWGILNGTVSVKEQLA